MFTADLCIVDKRWKQLRCVWNYEWVYKSWRIHTMEYYSAIKRNEVLSHANWKKPGTNAKKKKKRKRLVSKCGQILIISKHRGMYWCSYYILQVFCWNCSKIFLKGRVGGNFRAPRGWGFQKAFRLSSLTLCLHPGWGWANSCLSLPSGGMNYISEQHRPPLGCS